ncbi:MAG: hypothetical protein ACI4MJ_04860 [Aristaeellaceae bacterium]
MSDMFWCYVLLFFASSFLGWVMEVTVKAIQFRRFINRGFLIGPYCPIYGVGTVLLTALLSPIQDQPVNVFLQGMVVCGVLEYVTSWLMEKLFHARWWDYSHKRYNLHGRVCADNLLAFGVLGLLMIYVVNPWFFRLFGHLSALTARILGSLLIALILMDAAVSSTILMKIRHTADITGGDDTETITHHVRAVLMEKGMLFRRALRAFPEARLYNSTALRRLHQARKELEQELRGKRDAIRSDLDRVEEKLREDWQQRKDTVSRKAGKKQ